MYNLTKNSSKIVCLVESILDVRSDMGMKYAINWLLKALRNKSKLQNAFLQFAGFKI